jgi:surface-anchored protein
MTRCTPIRAAVAGAVLAMGLAAPAGAATIAQGHVDHAVRVVDGAVRVQLRTGNGAQAVWHEPSATVIRTDDASRTTIPSGPDHAFLGPAGARTWILPQTERPGVPWIGWSTEGLADHDPTGPVRWTLDAVEGPGTVALFQDGPFGEPHRIFDSHDGLPDALDVPVGAHGHGNWAFSRPGVYRLTTTSRATLAGTPRQDTQVLTVRVDGTDDAAAPGPVPPAGGSPSPAPGVPAAPGPGDAGARGTSVQLRTTRGRLSRSRTVALRVGCAGSRTCRGTVRLRTAGRVPHAGRPRVLHLGSRRYAVPGGRTATVRVRVPAARARTLRRRASLPVRASTRLDGRTVARRLTLLTGTAPR